MRQIKKVLGITLLSFATLVPMAGFSQDKTVETPDGKTITQEVLNRGIENIIREKNIPGISIAIINQNKLAYHNVFGVVNSETKELVTEQSIFEGASLSKPIFAYFALKMVDNGVLDLDRPLYEYLPHPGIAPESQEEYKLITARMVLAHQTGFPNHANGKPVQLAFTPGTDFMYSGEAYQYLAAIIGMLNGVGMGKDMNDLFQKEVTEPLQMEHTTFVWDDYLEKHKVYGHDTELNPTTNKPIVGRWSGKTFNAFSSIHSEASEYAKFIIAMLKREGLSTSSFDAMLKEETRFSEDNPLKKEIGQTGWGLGFAQKKRPNGNMHMHTGNNHDFQAYAMFIPEKEYGLVVFTNCNKMPIFLEEISKILGEQF